MEHRSASSAPSYNNLLSAKIKAWGDNMVETDKLLKWTISELNTLEINVNILIENVSARYKNDTEVENVISSIKDSFNNIRFELITNRN